MRSQWDIHGKEALSTVIHIFSTSGGKGVKADIPQGVINDDRLRFNRENLVRALLLNLGSDLIDMVIESSPLSHKFTDLPICVHHSGVVAATKGLTDLR